MDGQAARQGVGLDRETLTRLARVVRGFAASEAGGRAAVLAALLVALLLAINGLNVINSYVARDFMTAIERRDHGGFVGQALRYLVVFAASTLAAVFYRYSEERLGLLWREWMTRRLTGRYLDRRFYHQLETTGAVANPDQRITDDVRAFTTTTLSLALIFLNGTLTVLAFSGVLWSISRALFVIAVAYAACGSLVATLIGRPLVRLQYDQSDREADFRAQLVHVRANAESIALRGWEPRLARRLAEQIGALVDNFGRIIRINRNLNFFTTGYNYLIQLIPALVVAPLFIRGEAEFGVIPQSAMAFATLIGAFSLIVTQFPQLSSYAAVVARLDALGIAYQGDAERGRAPEIVDDPRRLAFERLTLLAPGDGRPLVRELSLEVPAAGRVQIIVADDLVTLALLRAMAGLWPSGSGRVVRPAREALAMLPERPYLPPGTVRQLLASEERGAPPDDAQVWAALRRIGLEDTVRRAGGLDAGQDVVARLSSDEQRLLDIARVLVAPPRYAVLADPAAGLGAAKADEVLAALAEAGVATVVLGPPAATGARVDMEVEIAADGTWRVAGREQGDAVGI